MISKNLVHRITYFRIINGGVIGGVTDADLGGD